MPKEKYSSLLQLLEKQGCQSVKNLSVAQNVSYQSCTVADELQQAVSDTIFSKIIYDMKTALCVAILTDENTDISVTGKLILYVKFVDTTLMSKLAS